MLRQHGQEVVLLSDLVRKFTLKQGNVKSVNFLRQMEFAMWAWKDIFRTTLWEVSTAVLEVDPIEGTITLPDNCDRLINIFVVDRFGRLQPLSQNPHINTAKIACTHTVGSCSCSCKGENTLCAALDSLTVKQEPIVVDGQTYTQVTYIKSNGCGGIIKEVHTYAYDANLKEVVPVINNEQLCNVEVNEFGCIKITEPNIIALQTSVNFQPENLQQINNRRVYVPFGLNPWRALAPSSYNFFGYWNWDASCGDKIHIFRAPTSRKALTQLAPTVDGEYVLRQDAIKQVVINYQRNGEIAGEEVLVPQYAVMAVEAGMIYQQAFFNPKDGDRGGMMERKYKSEKKNVSKFLNPMRIDDFEKLITNLPSR